jgi:small subunit ribosomal protein S15
MNQMAITPEVKKEVIKQFGASATDTGSPEAQVALLSKRIDEVTEHLKTNKNDHHNRRGLLLMVGKRRRILQYLSKTDINRYRAIIDKLGIRR